MSPRPFPDPERLERRYRQERLVRGLLGAALLIGGGMLLAGGVFLLLPGTRLPLTVVVGLPGLLWAAAAVYLLARWQARPSDAELARRADHVLGLPDHLRSLEEIEAEQPWRAAIERDARKRLPEGELRTAWPIPVPRKTWVAGATAVFLTVGVLWIGGSKSARGSLERAAIEEERLDRVAQSEEVFDDWKAFVEMTDDEELKELFTEAAELRAAMESPDPAEALLEMNELEQQISALQAATDAESLASEAAALAEAFEAFEGMSALAAALRMENFDQAAQEAEALAQEAAQRPNDARALSRAEAVAEMLARAAQRAGERGMSSASQALASLSEAAKNASKSGQVSNNALKLPLEKMREAFRQQQLLENRGRLLALSKSQLDALRKRVRRDGDLRGAMPSLCQACQGMMAGMPPGSGPGGKGAGTESGGPPLADPTKLLDPGVAEAVAGVQGEGESEVVVSSSNVGSSAAVSAGRETTFQAYEELSRQAVEDESLPIAHRETIRTYFESIRPVIESP